MNSPFKFPHRVRIHDGECGAVARALHHKAKIDSLPAVTKNVFVTTNERKTMSKKTSFKRLALVVVSALGFGFLSAAPSSATVSNVAISTPTAGSATFISGLSGGVISDTTTAASFTVTGLMTTSYDTMTVRLYENTKPTNGVAATSVKISVRDTTTANTFVAQGGTAVGTAGTTTRARFNKYHTGNSAYGGGAGGQLSEPPVGVQARGNLLYDSATVGGGYDIVGGGGNTAGARGNDFGNVGATFNVNLETGTTYTTGTYTYTVLVTVYSYTGNSQITHSWAQTTTQATVSIVVGAAATATAAAGKLPAAAGATAFIGTAASPGSDAVVSSVATASTTPAAYIQVKENNENGDAGVAEDSLTATITGPGLICSGDVCGKSLSKVVLASGVANLTVRADGTAGTATINISSTVVTFAPKQVTFYAKAAKTLTPTVRFPILGIGANTGAIGVTAVDADGIAWTGTAYIYATSAASALIAGSETPAACSWAATTGIRCNITGTLVGTAKFKIIDAATVATATASSDEFSVTVAAGSPGSVKLSFDKATYAPFEKAKITVTVLDTNGGGLPAQTVSNVFAAGGITTSVGFSQSSDTLTATDVVLQAASSSATGAVAGSQVYFVYMPASGGDVTISATGSTGLPVAARVAVSATAKVVSAAETAASTAATTAAAAQAAAEAATDAAAEAIDAANAATDAANLAAEAADAATVAAEEARDAADAATAAVEELATQVATLMAALKAQITTLANTVAKIAKKVKA